MDPSPAPHRPLKALAMKMSAIMRRKPAVIKTEVVKPTMNTPWDEMIDGKTVTLLLRTDSLFVDGKQYAFVVAGMGYMGEGDLVDILDIERTSDGTTILRGQSFGKNYTIEWSTEEFAAVVRDCSEGKELTIHTKEGLDIEFQRC